VTEIRENIYRIPVVLPGNPLKELNSYLIRDPERSLLIDTGFRFPACKEALLAGFGELGEDPEGVDIFLTHLHADHSGLSSEIVGEGRHIYLSEPDGAWLRRIPTAGDRWASYQSWDTLAGMPPDIIEQMQVLNPAVRFAPPDGARYTMLKDGDVLRAGGYELRCVLTPGHSPGHMCLWDEHSGLMFTGDHVLFDITPNITAWPDVEDSLGNYLKSLRAVRKYPVKTALPGGS
jgi:glyoxylase-like metal-dependent hydrolase (beta-lactamase superfamily II)